MRKNHKLFVNCGHLAFFSIVVLLGVLLWNFPIVHASTVSGTNWQYDDSNMESAVVKYELYMPDDARFLNMQDSGFPYNEWVKDQDGMYMQYTKFQGALYDESALSLFVNPSTFNNQNTSFNIPDSFTYDNLTYTTDMFTSANLFAIYYDYHPYYCLVLSSSSGNYSLFNYGSGFNVLRMNDTSATGVFCFMFNEGGNLTDIQVPRNIDGIEGCLQKGYLPLCGNSSIMSYYTELQLRENTEDFYYRVPSEDAENINYLQLGDEEYDDGSGGTAENNLYVRSADWKFNIPKYCNSHGNIQFDSPATRNWGEGTIIFSALLNDWQKANPDKLNIDYNFRVYLYVRYENDVNGDIGVKVYNCDADLQTDGLSQFISDGCSQTFKVSSIFLYCRNNSGNTVTDILESLKQHSTYDILDTVWYIDCTAVISNAQNGNNTSGPIKERYNFTNQISKELENTITENKNPYVDDDGNSQKPDNENDTSKDDDSSTNINNGDGNINVNNTNNNNPTFNNNVNVTNNNNPENTVNSIYDKLFPSSNADDGGLTDRFIEQTNTNGWFAVMAAALPIIPQYFWEAMWSMLTICLVITGVAFVFWIICHIL